MIECKVCKEQMEWIMGDGWKCRVCDPNSFAYTVKWRLTPQPLSTVEPNKAFDLEGGWKCQVFEHRDFDEPPFTKAFCESIRTMQHAVHENAKAHGWWDEPREDGTVIMLIVSELAELLEELRVGGRESAKIDGFTSEEEELADAVIRILDFAGRKNYRLGQAILAKHEYNKTRSFRHGNKLF